MDTRTGVQDGPHTPIGSVRNQRGRVHETIPIHRRIASSDTESKGNRGTRERTRLVLELKSDRLNNRTKNNQAVTLTIKKKVMGPVRQKV